MKRCHTDPGECHGHECDGEARRHHRHGNAASSEEQAVGGEPWRGTTVGEPAEVGLQHRREDRGREDGTGTASEREVERDDEVRHQRRHGGLVEIRCTMPEHDTQHRRPVEPCNGDGAFMYAGNGGHRALSTPGAGRGM